MLLIRFRLQCLILLVPTLAVISSAGCGGSSGGPKLTPVSGKVLLDGQPVPGVGVSFRADKGNPTQHIPSGAADSQGKYELMTAAQKGAPTGAYKVVVFPPAPTKGASGATGATAPAFNKKYSDVDTTDLKIEVKENAPAGSYDIQLKP